MPDRHHSEDVWKANYKAAIERIEDLRKRTATILSRIKDASRKHSIETMRMELASIVEDETSHSFLELNAPDTVEMIVDASCITSRNEEARDA